MIEIKSMPSTDRELQGCPGLLPLILALGPTLMKNREALAKGVLEAKEHYGQAIGHIEKALRAEGGSL